MRKGGVPSFFFYKKKLPSQDWLEDYRKIENNRHSYDWGMLSFIVYNLSNKWTFENVINSLFVKLQI